MVMVRSAALLACAVVWSVGAFLVLASSAVAQGPGFSFDNNRWCQTIRECRFTRGGVYRGCISTYSCRRCRFLRADCTIPGSPAGSTCRRLVCDWAGT